MGGSHERAAGFALGSGISDLRDLLLPRTDAGVLAQAVVVTIAFLAALVVVNRSREVRLLVLGIGLVALGWMALGILH